MAANEEIIARITKKLERWGAPMDVRAFSREEYRKAFPEGTVQTPIVIIQEEETGRKAYIFIKSFKNTVDPQKQDFIISVVVTIESAKIAISTYKRKWREVLSKIKRADVIAYEKDHGASRTNGNNPPSQI
ncbi:MAG: hypothetical protein LBD09_05990 [Treponema sp.]|nr:hypothetical protein [Treponema sp.]